MADEGIEPPPYDAPGHPDVPRRPSSPGMADNAGNADNATPEGDERRPMLEFEVVDPLTVTPPPGWWSRVRAFGKESVAAPVRYLIDPIAHWSMVAGTKFDAVVGRVMNPLLARRLLFLMMSAVVIALVYFGGQDQPDSSAIHADLQSLRHHIHNYAMDKQLLQETIKYFGEMPHLAGSAGDRSTAKYVHDMLESLGLVASMSPHDVMISHANSTNLWVYVGDEVKWESELLEGTALEANITESQQQPRPLMALSLPGDVRGRLVRGGHGLDGDLAALGRAVKDSIVLIEYGCEDPIYPVARAQLAGAAGVLLYTNSTDYPADAVKCGSLGMPWQYPGDPLSPGWTSLLALKAHMKDAKVAHIPVAPMSLVDADTLMDTLQQHPDAEVRLAVNPVIEERHQIANVFGRIPGIEQDSRSVTIGTRLDSFCYGASELAGLAALLDVARVLAYLRYEHGWQPLRTIYLVAWDGTDQNYAGATEWVESVADSLTSQGLAYIDLGGVAERSTTEFSVRGNPLLDIDELLKEVEFGGSTLWDNLSAGQQSSSAPISSYGNWLSFDVHTGVPSLEIGFKGSAPRGSCFDTVEWLETVGDPELEQHRALVEIAAFSALEYSSSPMLPFNVSRLGSEIHKYLGNLADEASTGFAVVPEEQLGRIKDAFDLVKKGADSMIEAGVMSAEWSQQWSLLNQSAADADGVFVEPPVVTRSRIMWNEQIGQLNKRMMDRNGIHNRNWFKHHLFGPKIVPGCNDAYAGTFPAPRDAIAMQEHDTFLTTLLDAGRHIVDAADVFNML